MARPRRKPKPKFLDVDGCPAPYEIAPYIFLVLRAAGQTAASIYRGDDPAARPILHAHGKHTQRELANATPAQRAAWGIRGTPNRPGYSQHELRGPRGEVLEDWEQGVDSGGDTDRDRRRVEEAAARYGWRVVHPYRSGLEGHHWRFERRPRPRSPLVYARVVRLRRTLPRR